MLTGRSSALVAHAQRATVGVVAPTPAWAPRRPAISCASTLQDGGKGEGRAVLTKAPEAPRPKAPQAHEPIGASSNGDGKKPSRIRAEVVGASGMELGPIGLTFGASPNDGKVDLEAEAQAGPAPSIHSMTTAEWRAKYEKDGTVDLWVEEEFNAGSRLVGGRAVHKGGLYGIRTGEGPSLSSATKHKVKIFNHYADQVVDVEVPEDRYILWEAEDEGLELPYACRMGCCTACAVRIVEGEMYQPEALGISAELREQGYGLMCVGFPLTDMVLETVPEDEVYELQFGASFASQALDPTSGSIERDDFALEVAMYDE